MIQILLGCTVGTTSYFIPLSLSESVRALAKKSLMNRSYDRLLSHIRTLFLFERSRTQTRTDMIFEIRYEIKNDQKWPTDKLT